MTIVDWRLSDEDLEAILIEVDKYHRPGLRYYIREVELRAYSKGAEWAYEDCRARTVSKLLPLKTPSNTHYGYYGDQMPNQAWGAVNNKHFYFRGRHGYWTLEIEGKKVADGKDQINGADPGWWEEEDIKPFVDALLEKLCPPS